MGGSGSFSWHWGKCNANLPCKTWGRQEFPALLFSVISYSFRILPAFHLHLQTFPQQWERNWGNPYGNSKAKLSQKQCLQLVERCRYSKPGVMVNNCRRKGAFRNISSVQLWTSSNIFIYAGPQCVCSHSLVNWCWLKAPKASSRTSHEKKHWCRVLVRFLSKNIIKVNFVPADFAWGSHHFSFIKPQVFDLHLA